MFLYLPALLKSLLDPLRSLIAKKAFRHPHEGACSREVAKLSTLLDAVYTWLEGHTALAAVFIKDLLSHPKPQGLKSALKV